MNNPRILVTGGSGLLGSYLLRLFRLKGYDRLTGTYQNPATIPEDLRDSIEWISLKLPDIPAAFDVVKDKDWVVHAAALVSYFRKDTYRLIEINQTGTAIIVNACLAQGVSHFVYVGSVGALGKETNHVTLDESNGWVQSQFSTRYGYSKYLGELEAWRGAGEGLHVSRILPSVILGAGDWSRTSLQLIDRVANKTPFYPGGQTGFVDVRDVAEFISLLLEHENIGERWLLNGANLSYKDIYLMIAEQLGLERKYREAPKWLARDILFVSSLKSGQLSVPDLINQIYGTFSYDASKSLGIEGFIYRSIEKTIKEIAEIYSGGVASKILLFQDNGPDRLLKTMKSN